MQIDWLTVAAQIVNFLLLVLLLRWALYRPLRRALTARQEAVTERLRQAETARAKAEEAAAAHTDALRTLEQERAARLQSAEQEGEAKRAELIAAAKDELAARRAAWQAQLVDEKADFLDRLRHRAGESFVGMARSILAEMADQDLVDRMAMTFAHRLSGLGTEDRALLHVAASAGNRPEILSSLPLSDAARGQITAAVGALLGAAAEPVFSADGDLACGVVLKLGSQRVGWTIAEHLDRFAQEVAQQLDTPEAAE